MVPKMFTQDKKQRRFSVYQEITELLKMEPDLLSIVITGDDMGLE